MFVARARIGNRQPGEGSSSFHPFAYRPRKRKEKEKFRCYVPCMWPTTVALLLGFLVMGCGVIMCVTGYFNGRFSPLEDNSNFTTIAPPTTVATTEPTLVKITSMQILVYLGPVLMGMGCFTVVVSCVVVCETRDKMVRIINENSRKNQKHTTKPDFYDLVIRQYKDKANAALDAAEREKKQAKAARVATSPRNSKVKKKMFNFRRNSPKERERKPGEYSAIGDALKSIPLKIFTIDLDDNHSASYTMSPVRMVTPCESRMNSGATSPAKYPSASCIHDLLKVENDKFNESLSNALSMTRRPKSKGLFGRGGYCERLKPQPRTSPLYGNQDSRSLGDLTVPTTISYKSETTRENNTSDRDEIVSETLEEPTSPLKSLNSSNPPDHAGCNGVGNCASPSDGTNGRASFSAPSRVRSEHHSNVILHHAAVHNGADSTPKSPNHHARSAPPHKVRTPTSKDIPSPTVQKRQTVGCWPKPRSTTASCSSINSNSSSTSLLHKTRRSSHRSFHAPFHHASLSAPSSSSSSCVSLNDSDRDMEEQLLDSPEPGETNPVRIIVVREVHSPTTSGELEEEIPVSKKLGEGQHPPRRVDSLDTISEPQIPTAEIRRQSCFC